MVSELDDALTIARFEILSGLADRDVVLSTLLEVLNPRLQALWPTPDQRPHPYDRALVQLAVVAREARRGHRRAAAELATRGLTRLRSAVAGEPEPQYVESDGEVCKECGANEHRRSRWPLR